MFLRILTAAGLSVTLLAGLSGPVAAAAPGVTAAQPTGFVVGADGRLYAATSNALVRVSNAVIGPAGAGISPQPQPNGDLAVFTVGNDGGLFVGATSPTGSGMSVAPDGPRGIAQPGTKISAAAGSTAVHVFFPGRNGALYHMWYPIPVRPGGQLRQVTQLGLAPPTGSVAAFVNGTVPGAVFAGANGAIYTVSGQPGGTWSTTPVTQANVTRPGSPVAATSTVGLNAFYTGTDGRLWRVPFTGGTPTPQPLSNPGVVPVGAHLAAAQATTGEWMVAYAGSTGAIEVATNAFDPDPNPWVISPAGVQAAGSPVSIGYGGGDYVFVGWCGNDVWWWLIWRWRNRPPPPPPPDPYHELFRLQSPIPLRQHFNVGVTMTRCPAGWCGWAPDLRREPTRSVVKRRCNSAAPRRHPRPPGSTRCRPGTRTCRCRTAEVSHLVSLKVVPSVNGSDAAAIGGAVLVLQSELTLLNLQR